MTVPAVALDIGQSRQPKRAPRAVPLTAEQLRLAETYSGSGAFEFEFAAQRWTVTPQVAVLFGWDSVAPRLSPDAWEAAILAEDRPKLRAALKAARDSNGCVVEFRVRHRDDSRHWLSLRGETIRDAAGQPRWLRGACSDVSERKALEARLLAVTEALEQRTAAQRETSDDPLRDSERSFRLLVEAVTDYAIYMLGPDGRVVSWNPGAERLKGYKEAEIVGRHLSCFYTPEDRAAGVPAQVLATAARDGRYLGEGWRMRKDGSRFWASVTLQAIRSPRGVLLGFAKITRDLTERHSAEERLRQAQKMEAVGQLTGGVAHDFNNLLTVIAGSLETMQRRLAERNEPVLRRLASAAMRATARAAVLTHQLLAFSRRQPLQPKSVAPTRLITGMLEMLRRTLPESVAIETVLGGGIWPIYVDANQLENCLLNLAVNARDAMPDGGKLTIKAANVYLDDNAANAADVAPGDYVGICVSDTGTGMPEDVVAKAFDPFFTTKDVGKGTGLGLSQVYGFVKQSGGHTRIDSTVGKGTTVKLFLPRLAAAEAEAEVPSPARVTRGGGEMILLVEDQADVRSFTADMLEELGYRVLPAADGAAALRLLDDRSDVALLFTDIGLPGGLDGRQLADEALRRRPGLAVLFTSGYARDSIVHRGQLHAGVQLITKPFSFAALAGKIRDALDAAG